MVVSLENGTARQRFFQAQIQIYRPVEVWHKFRTEAPVWYVGSNITSFPFILMQEADLGLALSERTWRL